MQMKLESKKTGLLKAFLYAVAAAVVFILVFSNGELVTQWTIRKDYISPAIVMSITLLVASFYGTATGKFLKHTLEKALESQCMREE